MTRKLILVFVSILINNVCYSQFGPQKDISGATSDVRDVKSCDLDGDGDMDLLTASTGDDKIAWNENLGNGLFGKQKIINKSVDGAFSVFASDIDNDGDLDVVFAAYWGNRIAWHENYGSGVFGPERKITTNVIGPKSVHVADMDNDGDMDVLSASLFDNKIAWYENLGLGTFGAQKVVSTIAEYAVSVFASDIDNDGDLDILAASYNDSLITWYENTGPGVIDTNRNIISSVAYNVRSVYSVDLDMDGDMDVLSASSVIAWNENLGGGSFAPRVILSITSTFYNSVYASDIDNDGDFDVLATSYSKVEWYENMGSGNIGTAQIISTLNTNYESGNDITTGDLDGDGDLDVISGSEWNDNLRWFENLGGGIIDTNKRVISAPTTDLYAVYAVDLDGDGDMDILSAADRADNISWYENLGGGTFGIHQPITFSTDGARSVFAADLDNDGDLDVLSASYNDNKIAWYENLGGGVIDTTQQIITTNAIGASSVHAVDLDGDGDMDVLAAAYIGDKITWHENLGGGVIDTAQQIISTLTNGANAVFAADLDGDLDMDIISSSYTDDKVAWYENMGGGSFGVQQIIFSVNGPNSIYSTDLDLDGDMDVVSSSWFGTIAWHENLGLGSFSPQQIITSSVSGSRSVSVGDLDGDGDMDVLSASPGDNKIAWYENLGSGNIGSQQIVAILDQWPCSVFSVDLDGDGDMDVLAGSTEWDDKIIWYESYFISPYQLKGKTFYDANQNGVFDSLESGFEYYQNQLQPNSLYNYSDNSGSYFFAVNPGTYTVTYTPNTLWSLTSDSSSFTRALSPLSPIIDSLDFGFYPSTMLTIINPELVGGFPRCGDTINYWINIKNIGTTIPSGVIQLQLDDSINFISSVIVPDSITGQILYWHYDSLLFYTDTMITIKVVMPPFTSMGDTLSSFLTVHELDSIGNSIYLNFDTLNQVSVCAYDPNDKSVNPMGLGTEGYISQNQELEYLIRFQNTGNDTAITVVIRDQLDYNLDWGSLQIIANSHPIQVSIEADGEVVFTFNNILLLDSGANFLGSQGFVQFSIQPKFGLAPLAHIINRCHIYFDNNPAVITNSVINTIECYSAPLPVVTFNFPYLFSGIIGNHSYQWYLNGNLIVGAVSDTLIPLANGNYTVEITDSNTCTKMSSQYVMNSLSIEKLHLVKAVVFPNPFEKYTTILFDKKLNGDFDLLIYNIIGKKVKRINKIAGNKVVIRKNDIGKGMFLSYLLNVKTGEKLFIGKLVTQ